MTYSPCSISIKKIQAIDIFPNYLLLFIYFLFCSVPVGLIHATLICSVFIPPAQTNVCVHCVQDLPSLKIEDNEDKSQPGLRLCYFCVPHCERKSDPYRKRTKGKR